MSKGALLHYVSLAVGVSPLLVGLVATVDVVFGGVGRCDGAWPSELGRLPYMVQSGVSCYFGVLIHNRLFATQQQVLSN